MTSPLLTAANFANNVASAARGIAASLGLISPEPAFPEVIEQGISADFQREHWYTTPSQGLYAFSVEEVGTGSVSQFPAFVQNIASLFNTLTGNGPSFGEFKLPLTPSEIQQVEDFAVSIKPTQGGVVVNHSGNRFKTLTISGTTGVTPFKGLLGTMKGNGVAIGKPDELQYRSGYEVFLHFRQWIRAYHQTKAVGDKPKLRMMFRNYKDWEFLYVEPLKFTMKRDASKPLLYNYFIQFKVLGVHTIDKPLFELVISRLTQVASAVRTAQATMNNSAPASEFYIGSVAAFNETLTNLQMALMAANRQPLTLAQFPPSEVANLSDRDARRLLTSVADSMVASSTDQRASERSGTAVQSSRPLEDANEMRRVANDSSEATGTRRVRRRLVEALSTEQPLMSGMALTALPEDAQRAMVARQTTAAGIARTEVASIRNQAQALADQLADGLGLSDPLYNQIFGNTAAITTEPPTEISDEQFDMLYALSVISNQIDGILSSDEMFDTNAQLYSRAGSENGSASIGEGVFAFVDGNTSTREGFLGAGQTLEDIALAELGDSSLWTQIAELNNLKAPYISTGDQSLTPNYEVQSVNYSNPADINDLQVGYIFQIPTAPTPSGAWSGKANYLAEFQGGTPASSVSWRFIYPNDGTLILNIPTGDFYRFTNGAWSLVDPSEFATDGVLKPGDKLLIPSAAASPLATPMYGPRDNPVTNGLSSGEKSLAVDLTINENFDLDMTPAGDLNIAYGEVNGAQAIILKLLFEKGSLKKFPSIGTNLTPGKKVPDIANIRTDLTTSLLQDSRIKSVTKINVLRQNNTTTLSFDVTFNDISQPVSVNIPI